MVWIVVGIVAGGALGWAVARGRFAAERDVAWERLAARDRELQSAQVTLSARDEELRRELAATVELRQEVTRLEAQIDAAREGARQRIEDEGALKAAFASLAADALRDNNSSFVDFAKEKLGAQQKEATTELGKKEDAIQNLVKPIEDGIKALSDAAREMEKTRASAFGTIEEQLRQAVSSAMEVAKQAAALKDALKRPNVRGRWGELQLKICVELAGMEEHCDVEFQETSLSADNETLRPDMIVRMPGGRKIAVDSKTPMVHFLSYIEASTDDERQIALVSHARSVKNHVGDLAKTGYMQKIAESPDFVVMFLPNESFLSMALEKEPTLMEDALKKKILIATPGTLIGLLKVVQFGWNEQKMAQNAQLIADEGSKLNGEIVNFLADFSRLGLALDTANEAFGSSRRRVVNQIATSSLNLTALGAKNRSSLTKGKKVLREVTNILKAAGADNEDIEQTENPEQLSLAAASNEDEIDV